MLKDSKGFYRIQKDSKGSICDRRSPLRFAGVSLVYGPAAQIRELTGEADQKGFPALTLAPKFDFEHPSGGPEAKIPG